MPRPTDDFHHRLGSNGYQLTTVTGWPVMASLETRERGSGMHAQQQTMTEPATAVRQFYASESQLRRWADTLPSFGTFPTTSMNS